MSQSRYLVYQAYGHPDIINEAVYSILSLIRVCGLQKLPRIILYTDNKAAFSLFDTLGEKISFGPLDQGLLQDWWGPQHFVHRAKICMLKDFFSKYEGTALYVDSDVVFRSDPGALFAKIESGTFLMHAFEGTILSGKTPILRKLRPFFKKPLTLEGKNLLIPLETGMWNAGVLGIPYAKRDLLDEVLSLTDHTFKLYPKHIMEQFAFSYILSKNGSVYSTEEEVFHYWNFKEFRPILAEYISLLAGKSLDVHLRYWEKINPMVLEVPKRRYEALPGILRALKKASGKKWVMPAYSLALTD